MRQKILLLTLCFFLSRLYAYRAGVRFDVTPLFGFAQIIDPALLRYDLLRSLWHLHSQPPAFNLYVGTVLKLWSHPLAFALSYQWLGLLMNFSLYVILRKLGVGVVLCFALTLLFMFSPSSVLYENWLFYNYPVTAFLVFALFFVHRLRSE